MKKIKQRIQLLLKKRFYRYLLGCSVLFFFWHSFLDSNSWLNNYRLSKKIDRLKTNVEYYQKEIAKDRKALGELNDPKKLEKFARENYYMKKKDEDVYIIRKK